MVPVDDPLVSCGRAEAEKVANGRDAGLERWLVVIVVVARCGGGPSSVTAAVCSEIRRGAFGLSRRFDEVLRLCLVGVLVPVEIEQHFPAGATSSCVANKHPIAGSGSIRHVRPTALSTIVDAIGDALPRRQDPER